MANPRDTYEPSPEEIRIRCSEIQEGWSSSEEIKRNQYESSKNRHYSVPEVKTEDLPDQLRRTKDYEHD